MLIYLAAGQISTCSPDSLVDSGQQIRVIHPVVISKLKWYYTCQLYVNQAAEYSEPYLIMKSLLKFLI